MLQNMNILDTDKNLLAKKIWNAFNDGTIQNIKEHDAQSCKIMHQTTGQIINLYNNYIERLNELKQVWECKLGDTNVSSKDSNDKDNAENLTLHASIQKNVSSVVALINKYENAKTNLQINILDPLIKDSDEYLLKIDDLIAQHAKLVDQLAIYNNECTLIERKYQDSCNSVDAAIERRNKYANEENQDGRDKLKKNVDSALEFMIKKECDYKEALDKYHQQQEDMQNKISELLNTLQSLKVNRVIYYKGIFKDIGIEMQHSSTLSLEFSQCFFTCSTLISTNAEVNNIVNKYESEGTFERKLRVFKNGESKLTSNQRKQYHQANNAYKHDGGKSGESGFLNTMKNVNTTAANAGNNLGTREKISLKKLEANHRNLDAQSKWKLKHGGGRLNTNPFSDLNSNSSKGKDRSGSSVVKKAPPSFKKPTFKKPNFKSSSNGMATNTTMTIEGETTTSVAAEKGTVAEDEINNINDQDLFDEMVV